MNRRQFVRTSSSALLAPCLVGSGQTAEAPVSPFGRTSTAEEVTEGLDLSGKTALVTGCNSGIGLETMRVLALRGAHVIGTGRTVERARLACDTVQGRATPVALELSDFDSVVACADAVQAMDTPIDMLICNAGMLVRELQQVNGLEIQFVVNHLGHFILTNRLLDRVLAAPEGRVAVVGSVSHRRVPQGGIQFDNLSGEGWARAGYSHSKLANGLFSLELATRLEGTAATSNSLHPGNVVTNITRRIRPPVGGGPMGGGLAAGGNRKNLAEGAATTCYVATYPALAGVSGCYFVDCNAVEPSDEMQDQGMASRLWQVSEELTRDYLAWHISPTLNGSHDSGRYY